MPHTGRLSDTLLERIMAAIADGASHIVLWGLNETSMHILATASCGGFLSRFAGLIDDHATLHGHSFFGLTAQSPADVAGMPLDLLVICSDKEKERMLEEYAAVDHRASTVVFAGQDNYDFDDPVYFEIVASCPIKSKAGGYPHMLMHLYQSLKYVAQRHLSGHVAEFGVFQGGTTVFMAKILRHFGHAARIYGFDTFAGFPPPHGPLDLYRDSKCEFHDEASVRNYCAPYDIELIAGDITDTFTRLRDIPLVLSFFDTDNYSATRSALDLCFEQTVPGGILAFDHFYSPGWPDTVGERIAIKQALHDRAAFNLHGTGIFIKV